MNIETGKVYTSIEAVAAAIDRGEELMKLTPADLRKLGIGAARRRRAARTKAKQTKALASAMASAADKVGAPIK